MSKFQALILGMIDEVPSGYYAVQSDETEPLTFMRVARPTHGRYKGYTKVQTQHSEMLMDRWLYNPEAEDRFKVRAFDSTIEQKILLLIANTRKAARKYAEEIGRCHRCNFQLTDERSRWYGFGPECEKYLEAEKDEIDDENGGTYEQLRGVMI